MLRGSPSLTGVVREVDWKGGNASSGAAVGVGVGTFGRQRPDKAFGFAVGLRAIGLPEALAEAELQRDRVEMWRAIRLAVVRRWALNDDAVGRVPGNSAEQEASGCLGGFVVEHLGVGQPRLIATFAYYQPMPVTRVRRLPCIRYPKRPSFLVSGWTSLPGRWRSLRGGQTHSSRFSPRPRIPGTTVEFGSSKYWAIRRLLQRCRRCFSIRRRRPRTSYCGESCGVDAQLCGATGAAF